ncbi:MAG: undecaprenyl diphosphate synthase [Marinimicrobia bacterium 46_43]|jgi:undecaprenyl diphosphate synthase|nr:MAG: undecaprenyl diphosphate synthase [Marinimicrobia bacterium 46_43]
MADLNQKILPKHVGFIVDGNRRWAKEKSLPTFAGHKKGAERIEEIVKYAQELGIKIITIYAFSTENWKRAEEETSYLMELFETYASNKMGEANNLGIQIRILGDLQDLPDSLQETLSKLVVLTRDNEKMIVNLALNYGGRDELVRTFRKLLLVNITASELTEELININLDTAGLPDPDMIIRTSGEQRLSNFLPWQSTYAELYFPKVHWPDFDKKQLDIAMEEFQRRQRRMGK